MISKPFQLKLKVAWFKESLGLSIDQVSLNQRYSLTSYYFLPRTQAWEQLDLELDSKPWLTTDEKIKILKTAGDIMEYWLSYRNGKNIEQLKKDLYKMDISISNIGL